MNFQETFAKFELVALDIDGVLVDSLDRIYEAFQSYIYTFSQINITKNETKLNYMVGSPKNIIEKFISNHKNEIKEQRVNIEALKNNFNMEVEKWRTAYKNAKPKPKADDFSIKLLAKLKDKNIPVVLITSGNKDEAQMNLSVLKERYEFLLNTYEVDKVKKLFDAVIDADDVGDKCKPDPFPMELALNKLKLDGLVAKDFIPTKENTCFIGDGESDVEFAIKLGIRPIFVKSTLMRNYNDPAGNVINFNSMEDVYLSLYK